ncbi:MAG: plasmid maintenance system killer family protein [Bacteroidetes bacterium]|nr:MAG: plasmid maintenance system killer family protein [Bacteroidota bacterium]
MIVSFKDKETEKILNGIVSKKLHREIRDRVRRKVSMINNSIDVSDLRIPPANRLEKLKENLKALQISNERIRFDW